MNVPLERWFVLKRVAGRLTCVEFFLRILFNDGGAVKVEALSQRPTLASTIFLPHRLTVYDATAAIDVRKVEVRCYLTAFFNRENHVIALVHFGVFITGSTFF